MFAKKIVPNSEICGDFDQEALGETVNLGILQNQEIVYADILEGTHPFRMVAVVGSLAPIHASAIGKSIAAFLPKKTLHAILKNKNLCA